MDEFIVSAPVDNTGKKPWEAVFADRGTPEKIIVHEFDRDTEIFTAPQGVLSLVVENYDTVRCHTAGTVPMRYRQNGADVVEYSDLRFCAENGIEVPDFHLALRHEFFPDGVGFTTAIFHGETSHPPKCRDLKLRFELDFSSFDQVRFACYPRTGSRGAADIQSTSPRRFLDAGENICLPGNLVTFCNFNLFRNDGPSMYAELFLEGANSLSGDLAHTSTTLQWQGNSPVLEWNFQTEEFHKKHRPLQWRNRWGWFFAPPSNRRKLPPQHCYHFIDNYRHYPAMDELQTIADTGCNMLIIHSNWRRDAASGCVPYNEKILRQITAFADEKNLSLLLYVRGNEQEIVENQGAWFKRFLNPDKDGLYMDYGGPTGRMEPPSEFYPGGRACFYQHYLTLQKLRENLGEKALLISHTGAWFSAVGISFADAYISGEGERGKLLAGMTEYSYFTMNSAAPGSLWSAAFPEYTTLPMIPFMASSGQFPHSALGMQFASSSLIHPPEPGINDRTFMPLWKLWSCMAKERDVAVFSNYNTGKVFSGSKDVSSYLMVSGDGKSALLVLSGTENGTVGVNWSKCGFDPAGKNCFKLTPDMTAPAAEKTALPAEFAAELTAYPACAYFITAGNLPADYLKPYPDTGTAGKKYLANVDEQRQLRQVGATGKAVLRLRLDDKICTALEDSMVVDLYDESIELGVWENETFRVLGIITPAGLAPADAVNTTRIMPGDVTANIDLAALTGPGKFRFAVKSNYMGEAFYNFVHVQLDTDNGSRELEFSNQLEVDRAFINWTMEIC